jgi:hypothetical protein
MSVDVVEPQQSPTLCMFIIVTLQGCCWQLYSGNTELRVDVSRSVALSCNILSRLRSILLVIKNDVVKMTTL